MWFWLVPLVILIAVVAAAFYLWQTRFNVPRLTYTLLPAYEIPDVILVSGIIVENRGRKAAPNVKLTIRFEGDGAMIHHLKLSSSENAVLRSGGERFTFVTVSTRTLRPDGKIFINWAAAKDIHPQTTLTSYQPTVETLVQKLQRFLPHRAEPAATPSGRGARG